MPRRSPEEESFWSKVVFMDDCWEWIGPRTPRQYGIFRWNKRPLYAHRWSYERVRGQIPAGLVIDHLCRNHSCVNPAHMEVVTNAENVRRGRARYNVPRATHCKRGHELTPENTRMYSRGEGYQPGRHCIACQRITQKRNYQEAKAKREARRREIPVVIW